MVTMPAQAQQFTRTITDGEGLPEGSGSLKDPYQVDCSKPEDRQCTTNVNLRGCSRVLEYWRFIDTTSFGENSEVILPVYTLRLINLPRCERDAQRPISNPLPRPPVPTQPTGREPSCPSGYFIHSVGQGNGGITWVCMNPTNGLTIINYGPGNNYKGVVTNMH